MNNTIREIIIQDFIARLAVITVSNGYATASGSKVLRARKKIDPVEVPASVVFPQPETGENLYGKRKCTMGIKLNGIVKFYTEDPSVVSERILGDLKKCIMAPENLLTSPHSGWSRSPDYIDSIIYTGGGPIELEDGETHAGAYANFDVTYKENINDPCSQ